MGCEQLAILQGGGRANAARQAVMDHKHTHSRDGDGLRRLRADKRSEDIRKETLRLREQALADARKRIERSKR
jgi:hypothetical protein